MRGGRALRSLTGAACGLAAMTIAVPAAASQAPAAPGPAGHASAARVPASSPGTSSPAWKVNVKLPLDLAVPPQEVSSGYSFFDVEAVGAHDAWTVGTSGRNILQWARPRMRHWHNGQWLAVKLPSWMNGANPGGWVNEFRAVGGSSPSNVWAVGQILGAVTSVDRAVVWNGRRWAKRGALASPGAFAPTINSVLSTGPSNAWALGCFCAPFNQSPYIGHFSHGRWHDLTPPGLEGGIWTGAVVSPSNIWAVMSESDLGLFTGVLHWNGVKWSVMKVPAQFTNGSDAFAPGGGIIASRHDGLWFPGSLNADGSGAVIHEIGGRWRLTKIGAPTAMQTLVRDGKGGFWSSTAAVGNTSAEIWHFAGGHWHRVADPAGISGSYGITWMAHVPGGTTSLAIGGDQKNEVLLTGGVR